MTCFESPVSLELVVNSLGSGRGAFGVFPPPDFLILSGSSLYSVKFTDLHYPFIQSFTEAGQGLDAQR